jgi:hypothetical protein
MTRLQQELQRLYLPLPAEGGASGAAAPSLIDAQGQVRAMVLTLAAPADWPTLWRVWNGVQADLGLPAPAIAVSGTDGHQLWFSLAEPVPAAQAQGFLAALCRHYLADIEPARLRAMPVANATPGQPPQHAEPVPAEIGNGGHWSAFVAPDLAPVFADEPWLDLPPSPDGQAQLLARLQPIRPGDLAQAWERLRPDPQAPLPTPGNDPAAGPAPAAATAPAAPPSDAPLAATGPWLDPRQFLLAVMNDQGIALGLRIEAAKALLAGSDGTATR